MKRTLFVLAMGILLLMVYNLSVSIYTLWQKKDIIIRAQKELEKQKKDNKELNREYERAKKTEFIEEEARNKLFLVKPGESEVILPAISSQASGLGKANSSQNTPNWQKWWNLFFQ